MSDSRAWHQLHVFPRLALVARFPVLGTSVFPRLKSMIASVLSSLPQSRQLLACENSYLSSLPATANAPSGREREEAVVFAGYAVIRKLKNRVII